MKKYKVCDEKEFVLGEVTYAAGESFEADSESEDIKAAQADGVIVEVTE